MWQSSLECSCWNCTSQEGGKPVGLENPACRGAPGCKIRASRLQHQHKFSSQAASQIPFTQWWGSDRHKVSVFLHSHLCISGYFYGMCFWGFFGFLWRFSCIKPRSREDFVQVAPETPQGCLWRARPLEGGPVAEGNVGHPAHRNSTGWGFWAFMDIKIVAQEKLSFWGPFKAVVPVTGLWTAAAWWASHCHLRNLFSGHWSLDLQTEYFILKVQLLFNLCWSFAQNHDFPSSKDT